MKRPARSDYRCPECGASYEDDDVKKLLSRAIELRAFAQKLANWHGFMRYSQLLSFITEAKKLTRKT